MFFKKKAAGKDKDKSKAKDTPEMKISLDSLEMESVAEQLREIEKSKPKKGDKKAE
jgi:hypothetical protein